MSNTSNHLTEISLVPGMTLRDYFAAHASDDDIGRILSDFYFANVGEDVSQPTRAEAKYMHADAMLAAREVNK